MPCPSVIALRALRDMKSTQQAEEPLPRPEHVNGHPGYFITIEGIEGAGKSTLAESLSRHLRLRGLEVVLTAEPGGDPVAIRIRSLLLDSDQPICDRAELMLFEAARAQHVESVIRPALGRGAVVISDRYADSSVAYQGFARGLEIDAVGLLNGFATNGLVPDLTILLDLAAEQGLARELQQNRVSSEKIAFHEAVRQGFVTIAKSEPERFEVIDAGLGADEVLRLALAAVDSHWPS